jgi:hypothetical protein
LLVLPLPGSFGEPALRVLPGSGVALGGSGKATRSVALRVFSTARRAARRNAPLGGSGKATRSVAPPAPAGQGRQRRVTRGPRARVARLATALGRDRPVPSRRALPEFSSQPPELARPACVAAPFLASGMDRAFLPDQQRLPGCLGSKPALGRRSFQTAAAALRFRLSVLRCIVMGRTQGVRIQNQGFPWLLFYMILE